MFALCESDIFILSHFDYILIFCFQGQQEIRFLVIVATPFQLKIRIMTSGAVTVLWGLKEPGGTLNVMVPTWTVSIIMARTHLTLMASTGITGKDITTPPRGLRWKSDQWRFRTSYAIFLCFLKKTNNSLVKKCNSDWMIKKQQEKYRKCCHWSVKH